MLRNIHSLNLMKSQSTNSLYSLFATRVLFSQYSLSQPTRYSLLFSLKYMKTLKLATVAGLSM